MSVDTRNNRTLTLHFMNALKVCYSCAGSPEDLVSEVENTSGSSEYSIRHKFVTP